MKTTPASLDINCQCVGALIRHVRSEGGNADRLIARFGLPADVEKQNDVEVSIWARIEIFAAAERELRDPNVGIHLALRLPRGRYGVTEYSTLSAPTFREACQKFSRYAVLLNSHALYHLGESNGEAVITHRVKGVPSGPGRHVNEFSIVALQNFGRQIVGQNWSLISAWFIHPAPDDSSELSNVLGTRDLRFGCVENGMRFDARLLDLRAVTSDPALLQILEKSAEEALSAAPPAQDFVGQVRPLIRQTLQATGVQIDEVARVMKVSSRTLQRRLAEHGVTFQQLVDDVRSQLAQSHLRDPDRTLADVAYLLGYSDTANFLRAFKRWTGKTPGEFRRHQLAAAS